MKKVRINPGVCGLITTVEAEAGEGTEVRVRVQSDCPAIVKMMEALGDAFDSYEVCLVKPGVNAFYEYAAEHLPVHAGCPVMAGITKCIEAEARLALPRDSSIVFEA